MAWINTMDQIVFFNCPAQRKIQNNETTKEIHPLSLFLSRCGVAVGSYRARIDLVPLALANRQLQHEEGTVETKVLAGHSDPEFHSQPPPLQQHVRRPP